MDMNDAAPVPRAVRLEFDGALNFRDLGGLRTRDGRRVAAGRLFRSDALWQLSARDLERLATLRVRTVCDLRAAHECERWPNVLPDTCVLRTLNLGFTPRGTQDAWDAINRGELSAEAVRAYMRDHYRALVQVHPAHYARLFEALAQPEALPLLVHCASGKDRSGWAAALILMALDVPRDEILADYVISDRHRRELSHLFGPHVDPAAREAVASADPAYLQAAFDLVDAQWGGDTAYLEQVMGVDARARASLRERLLE